MRLLLPLLVSAVLFALGVYGVLARRNAVLVLMSVELMLNAVTLTLVAFDAWFRGGAGPTGSDPLLAGQVLTLIVITVAAAEVGLGLAIVLLVFRTRATADLGAIGSLSEPAEDVRLGAGGDRALPDAADPVEPTASAGAAPTAPGGGVQP